MSEAATGAERRPARVRIGSIATRGFRSLGDFRIELEPETTYLVGANNSGKSSVLVALMAALGRYRPTTDDLARTEHAQVSDEWEVDIAVHPSDGDVFGTFERGALGGNVHLNDEVEVCWIRSTFRPSKEGSQLRVTRTFLQPGRGGDLVPSTTPFPASVLELFECEILDATRDLVADLGNKGSRWGRLLFDLQVPELPDNEDGSPNPRSRTSLQSSLSKLATDLKLASPVLTALEADLRKLGEVQSTVGNVVLQPFPPELEDVMKSVDVLLSNGTGAADLPLRFHGIGSRSLASLFVFSTLCSLRLGMDRGLSPHFLTLVEEPEAHLHPGATVALRHQLERLPGQKVVTTHSTHLVSEVPPWAIRVLRRSDSGLQVSRLSRSALDDTARFRRFVERPFGEIFFARVVIFGDGAAERDTLPVLLSEALGSPASAMGVVVVDSESLGSPQSHKLAAAVADLGIPWLVFCDNDAAGLSALSKILDPGDLSPLHADSPRVVLAGEKAMEAMLLSAGYGDEVDEVASLVGQTTASDAERLAFLKKTKGWSGQYVAALALEHGKDVPPPVRTLGSRILVELGVMEAGGPE